MSVIKELSKEIEENPELAKDLVKKLIKYIPEEVLVSAQIGVLAEQMAKLAEEQTKIWQEIKAIKQEQKKIWQEIKELKQEIKELKEEQTKIWQEIKAIKQEQKKIWQEIKELKQEQQKLREDFNKMLEVIKEIKERQSSTERALEGLKSAMMYGFSQLSKFAGVTFEQFVRTFLTELLRKYGDIPEGAELKSTVLDGEEVDIFLEDPLIVGEVTAYAEPDELDKLLRKAEIAERIYGKKAKLFLIVETADSKVAKDLRAKAKEKGVELIIGKEV